MPIVFAPPEPVAPGISQGAGAAEQWSRDFPTLQRQQSDMLQVYMNAARLAQQSGEGAANRQLHAALAEAQLHQQAQLQAGQQQNQLNLSQMHGNQQMAQQERGAQLQDQLQQNQLTRGEQLRLQRLQEARSNVQSQVDEGSLSREEGNDLLTQIQTGVSPLEQRQRRSQTATQELQRQALHQQMAQQEALWNENQRYRAGTLQDHLTELTDPNTGERVQVFRDRNGDPTPVFERPQGRGAGAGQGAGAGGAGRAAPVNHAQLHARAVAEAQAVAGRDELGHQRPVTEEGINQAYQRLLEQARPPAETPAVDPGAVRREVWGHMRSLMPNASVAELHRMTDEALPAALERAGQPTPAMVEARHHRQAREEVDRMVAGMTEETRRLFATPAARREFEARALRRIREAGAAPAEPQPFDPNRPESLNDDQRQSLANFQELRRMATSPSNAALGRDREMQGSYLRAIDEAQGLLTRFGARSRMPVRERGQYDAVLRRLGNMPRPF